MDIGTQIRLLALALVLATASALGAVTWWGFDKLVGDLRRDSLARLVATDGERLQWAFLLLRRDTELVAALPAVRRYAAAAVADERDRMANVLAELARGRTAYTQLSVIAAHGGTEDVVARVRRDGDRVAIATDAATLAPEERALVRDAMHVAPGAYWLSPVDLARALGQVAVPHRPVVRAAVPVADANGAPWGLVMIEVDFGLLIDRLMPDRLQSRRYRLTDAQGEYLVHEDERRTFAFAFDRRSRLTDEAPEAAALLAPGAPVGATLVRDWPGDEGALAHFRRIEVEPRGARHAMVLGIISSPAGLASNTSLLVQRGLLATAGLLLLALAIGYVGSSLVARPIRRIGAAARAFAGGHAPIDLPSRRTDEIGDLARTFDAMTQSLQQQRADLGAANRRMETALRDLDHFAHVAAHDLREPVRRITAYADLLDLREGARLSDDGRRHLDRLRSAADGALQQIAAFRELVDLRQSDLARVTLNLNEIARTACEELSDELDAAGIEVDLEPLPHVGAYEHLVPVLFRRLLQHAIAHVRGARTRIRIAAIETRTGWHVTFRSTLLREPGGAVAEAAAYNPLAIDALSADLGLVIARRIVERHAGRLEIRSGEDHVEFEFDFGSHADIP